MLRIFLCINSLSIMVNVMNEIFISRQQFDALISRVEEIRDHLPALKPAAPLTESYLEAHDITRLYHISTRTLERWRQQGRLPYHKIGNFIYFNAEDIRGRLVDLGKRPGLTLASSVCRSDKELRERHRVLLLTRRFYKVPP
jgi:hypothetical protein